MSVSNVSSYKGGIAMFTVKRLSECTFQQAVDVWNRGFEGYYFPMNTDVYAFTQRLANEGISPDHSLVAFHEDRAVGFVLNGIRMVGNRKIAWNGGTGVSPEYRHQGVGRMLMKAALDVYRGEKVNLAFLEAIRANENAIKLYQQMGYEVVDQLVFYTHQGDLPIVQKNLPEGYSFQKGIPQDVRALACYRAEVAWQTQWASVRDGESLLLKDEAGKKIAYALFKRTFDTEGKQTGIILYQAVVQPAENSHDLMECLLAEVFSPLDQSYQRSTVNIPVSNQLATGVLVDWGFTVRAEQVFMIKRMDEISC